MIDEFNTAEASKVSREIIAPPAAQRKKKRMDFAAPAGGAFGAAIASLEIARDVVRTNAPINEREGARDQAKLERSNDKSYTAAIRKLKTCV
jgi:hypothetical protein